MKIPREVNTYCPKCNVYTAHSVFLYKGGKRRSMAEGERRYSRKKRGYGSKRKPEQKRFAKVTKKQTLKLTCKKCGKTIQKRGIRLKKLEIVEIMR